jgi:hypothetical protein
VAHIIEEKWLDFALDGTVEQVPRPTPQGLPEFGPDGTPVLMSVTTLVFQDGNRRVKFLLTDEAKQALLQRLAGGIVIPTHKLN